MWQQKKTLNYLVHCRHWRLISSTLHCSQTGAFAGFAWVMERRLCMMRWNAKTCALSGQRPTIEKELLWCFWRCNNNRVWRIPLFLVPAVWFDRAFAFPRIMTVLMIRSLVAWSWILKVKRWRNCFGRRFDPCFPLLSFSDMSVLGSMELPVDAPLF